MNSVLLLGSASPRRREILRKLGIEFDVLVPEVDEKLFSGNIQRTVRENSERKFEWCRERMPERRILTADTLVILGGRVLEKPASIQEARDFVAAMSGKEHEVFTAVTYGVPRQSLRTQVARSVVVFKQLTPGSIVEYFSKVDPLDKAGGYDINTCSDMIIERIEGSYTNVMGLPEEVVEKMVGGGGRAET